MFDAVKMLGSFLESQTTGPTPRRLDAAAEHAKTAAPSTGLGNFGAGSLGAIAGAVLGKSGPGMLGGGLMGVVGNIAFQALQSHIAGATAPAPVQTERAPSTPDAQRKATLMVRAMLQAAKADGVVDAGELRRINEKIGNDHDAAEFVRSEMSKPIDLPGLCRDVHGPEEAAEVYTASLLVIDLDTPAERDYLADLASNLNIAPHTVSNIHAALGIR